MKKIVFVLIPALFMVVAGCSTSVSPDSTVDGNASGCAESGAVTCKLPSLSGDAQTISAEESSSDTAGADDSAGE